MVWALVVWRLMILAKSERPSALVVGIVSALAGAVFAVLTSEVVRSLHDRSSEASNLAVLAFTVNENSRAIGSLETAVNKVERKVATFEGVLSARLNYGSRSDS